MEAKENESAMEVERVWRIYLNEGIVPSSVKFPWFRFKGISALYHHLPSSPRCRVCHLPFGGVGGVVMRHVFGIVPSRLNPQMCNECEQFAEKFHGGAEIEVTVLFADVRGSTQLAENMPPAEFSRLINRFYNAATSILFDSHAMVEKLIGDAVTGFFTAGHAGLDHPKVAVRAACEILRATGHVEGATPWISVGIGVHTGLAYVGAVNSEAGVADIAVLGDTPNIGARLASLARPGEILLSRSTGQAAGVDAANVEIRSQELKGRAEPVEVWAISHWERREEFLHE